MVKDHPCFHDICNLNWSLGPITFWGITFTHDKERLFHLNYTPKLSRLKSNLHLWSQRDLTPIGKITLVKTLGLSQLVFLFQVLPNPPLHFVIQIEATVFDFIWSGNRDKVKRSALINDLDAGGLKAPHIHSFIRGLKCSWVRRYIDDNEALWKLFFDHYLKARPTANLLFLNVILMPGMFQSPTNLLMTFV